MCVNNERKKYVHMLLIMTLIVLAILVTVTTCLLLHIGNTMMLLIVDGVVLAIYLAFNAALSEARRMEHNDEETDKQN